MNSPVEVVFAEQAAIAFRALPEVVRRLIPAGIAGAYVLFDSGLPFYVGRSDCCLLARIAGHPSLSRATHVTWAPCASPMQAYHLESAYFHTWATHRTLMNRIHPAKPAGMTTECPFCGAGDSLALRVALGRDGKARRTGGH